MNCASPKYTRREAARLIGGTAAGLLLPVSSSLGQAAKESILRRAIPSTGEKISVMGLGTSRVFDVGTSETERKPLEEVLSLFVKLGGQVIDSSPMYGQAELVSGDLAANLRITNKLFWATKVWTRGKQAGIESMERSLARFRTKKIDLMQVHNLVDLETQLATMREWKAPGRIRYLGITHSRASGHDEVESLMRSQKLDFVQINYSIMEREVERRILPLAQERGVALLINRPFGAGELFSQVRDKPLPEWAAEFDCRSWAQFFLKWILGHPAATCVIPATSKPRHMEDNMQAGIGRLPDAKQRQRMVEFISAL